MNHFFLGCFIITMIPTIVFFFNRFLCSIVFFVRQVHFQLYPWWYDRTEVLL